MMSRLAEGGVLSYLLIITATVGQIVLEDEFELDVRLTGEDVIYIFNMTRTIYKDYTNLSLQDLPHDIPSNIEALLLANSSLTSPCQQLWNSDCGPGSCTRFPHLSYIHLSRNKIKNISPRCFSGMRKLATILLDDNELEEIPHDLFAHNKILAKIYISGNRIQYIEPQTFQNLTELFILCLDHNQISDLHPDTFRGLHKLIILFMNDNNMTYLDANLFRDLVSLRILGINKNRLTHICENTFHYNYGLVYFDASHNQLDRVNSVLFSNTRDLRSVNLSHNSIRELSKYFIQDILKVRVVDLSFNHLESVYLSRIPVSLKRTGNSYVLDRKTDLCTGLVGNRACFKGPKFTEDQRIFHKLDFSCNNIKKIEMNKDPATHKLEVAKIFLQRNVHIAIPIYFIKQESYIIDLKLDALHLDWRNITLFNEIFQLQNLKSLSIIDCAACEHFMKEFLSTVFNYNLRVIIYCDAEQSLPSHMLYDRTEYDFKSHPDDVPKSTALVNTSCTDFLDQYNITSDSETFSYYPCHTFDKPCAIKEQFLSENRNITCELLTDCSYLTLLDTPKINSLASCLLLSHNNIRVIKEDYFFTLRKLKYLDLAYNELYLLSVEMFNQLSNLEILRLDHNFLEYLNVDMFKGLTSLTILTLHENKVSSFAPDTLKEMYQLELLSIDFDYDSVVHDRSFHNLRRLRFLQIRYIFEKGQPKKVLREEHLKSLQFLEYCAISGFKVYDNLFQNLLKLRFLRELTIVRSSLPELCDEPFNVSGNVKKLELRSNKMKVLAEDTFRFFESIVHLDMSDNEITTIHSNLFANTLSLENLNMSINQIYCIPPKIFDSLKELKYLDLSFNKIAIFDWKAYLKLCNTIELNVSGNMIGSSEIGYISTLSTINLNCNSSLSYHILGGGNVTASNFLPTYSTDVHLLNKTYLRYLDISRNNITYIKYDAFFENPLLDTLMLDFNNIKEIDSATFKSTPFLRILSLSYNFMSVISKDLFKNLKHLRALNIGHNELELIEDNAFSDLNSLVYLLLGYNKLKTFDFECLPYIVFLNTLELSYNKIESLHIKHKSFTLNVFSMSGNPLKSNATHALKYLPMLRYLYLSDTSMCEFGIDAFQDNILLRLLSLGVRCLRGLTAAHFYNLQELIFLNLHSLSGYDVAPDTRICWKNITLINKWFEMPNLDYLSLGGHPICDDAQFTQIMLNLFLSEKWKQVRCSAYDTVPDLIVRSDGKAVINA